VISKNARVFLGVAALASVSIAIAQRGGYGVQRVWWDSGVDGILAWEEEYENPNGLVGVLNTTGAVHTKDHPFFEPLGKNRRACVTCHQPSNAMSISVATLRERWTETAGKDPVFAAIDGSNCPSLPQNQAASHSLLLDRGLFRIPLAWPPKDVTPEFQLEVVRDPTGCNTSRAEVSVYRRPRMTANLKYIATGPAGLAYLADGREPTLRTQAISAAIGHEESEAAPSEKQLLQIVDFESQIYVAQTVARRGGMMSGPLPLGPDNLRSGKFGALDANSVGVAEALHSFDLWKNPDSASEGIVSEFRSSVARGSDVFFGKSFRANETVQTCASCHTSGTTRWIDIGTANHATKPAESKAESELPLFKITCDKGRVIYSHDPGRALISGKCADVGAIVVPQFRGLAARAPYFSNGSAQTLDDVVGFYESRFKIGLTQQERKDLASFLSVL
jgi:cytochrome c peroxidase